MDGDKRLKIYLDVNLPRVKSDNLSPYIISMITRSRGFRYLADDVLLDKLYERHKYQKEKVVFLTRDFRFKEDAHCDRYKDCPIIIITLQDIYPKKRDIGTMDRKDLVGIIETALNQISQAYNAPGLFY